MLYKLSNENMKIGHIISNSLDEERNVWDVMGELDFWIYLLGCKKGILHEYI